ncbi:hypothetical protein VOLCADRAFT_87297 [Volvox carteri f. nagariensis]|uniref:Uncharacterized protein n=1 Tax=Volvox carteri f. nagariensis TaxID=3068 RepID=D8TKZ0_VOLCA|nr:uncharacterized protein VOLCADRAFT_87297 [Volvox carteri f. nagariensis]EFJ51781.1 hypothetical protein VOLCADRAFT_87297 [Volvox carteri f. nagariensis]|eukprot:XP_002947191.1 hypothetical protein VOLCADRAFT_87297 [Volvox carteri f. nagariensis]
MNSSWMYRWYDDRWPDATSNASLNSAAGQQLLRALQEAQAQQAQTIAQQAQTIAQQAQIIAQLQATIAQRAQIIAQLQATIAQLQRDIKALQVAQQAPRWRGLLRLFSCC